MPRRYNTVAKRKSPLVAGTLHPNDRIALGPGDLVVPGDGPRPHAPSTARAGLIEYTDEESEFLRAVDRYKVEARRPFPCLTEVLGVLKSLGYRKP